MKKTLAVLLTLIMVLGLLSGCGAKKESEEKVLNTYIAAEPSSLDLSRRSDSYSSSILINTVEGLVRTELQNGEYVTAPGDAESWECSEDGTVWTFHLNKNAKWEDGKAVTADQYVYSLQRSADPATGCPNSFFLEPLKNFAKVNSGEAPVEELGVEAIDEHTLQLTLENALPAFLQMLSGTVYNAQRQDIVEKYGDKYGTEAESFISNGPFKVASWTHNSSIVLVKNDQYWDKDKVMLDKVNYAIMSDENTYYNAFESGELDYVAVGTQEWLDRFAKDENNELHQYPTATLAFNFFNCADELFCNANIRKAFGLALDAAEFNKLVCSGLRTPTYGWIVPSMSVDGKNFREAMGDPTKDLLADLAAEGKTPKDVLLQGMKELGLGDDPSTLKVTMSLAGTSDWYRTAADWYLQSWQDVLGVTVDFTFNEWGIFYDNVEQGNYQMGFMGWGAYYNDPYDTLSLFVSSTDAICTNWASDEFDALIKSGSIELDGEKRMQIYGEAEHLVIYDECVAFPLTTANQNEFVKKYVKNFPEGAYNNAGLKYVDIVK